MIAQFAAFSLAVLLAVGTAVTAAAETAADGKALAEASCAKCHAVGKDDKSKLPIAPAFRTFAAKWPGDALEPALTERIAAAHPPIPAFKLEAAQIATLAAYLRTLGE